jgi:FKBP-type peptidyl-prolyl cis-trans isomerase SlyD
MVKDGSVVSICYRLTNAAGEELDRAEKADPFFYLHGSGQIIPGLESALLGSLVGTKKQVRIEPKDAYGEVDENLVTEVSRKNFPPGQALEVGMKFAAEVEDGESVVFTITGLEGERVAIDGNHPLAGETLQFEVEVLSVRDATPEELEHGHAHGPDGHHHH